MSAPLTIAVLLPTYNRPEFLPQACDSLLRQTYPYWHAYVSDDGSAIPAVAPNDSRFSMVHHPHGGLAVNFNRLLKMWRLGGQERATWLGDDDILLPDALENMVAHQTADVVFSDLRLTNMIPLESHIQGTATKGTLRSCDPSTYSEDFFGTFKNNFNMGTGFVSRRVLDMPGFDERFTTGMEDGIWPYSLFMHGISFDHFPIVTKYYRIHPKNNSRVENIQAQAGYAADQALLPVALAEIQASVV